MVIYGPPFRPGRVGDRPPSTLAIPPPYLQIPFTPLVFITSPPFLMNSPTATGWHSPLADRRHTPASFDRVTPVTPTMGKVILSMAPPLMDKRSTPTPFCWKTGSTASMTGAVWITVRCFRRCRMSLKMDGWDKKKVAVQIFGTSYEPMPVTTCPFVATHPWFSPRIKAEIAFVYWLYAGLKMFHSFFPATVELISTRAFCDDS